MRLRILFLAGAILATAGCGSKHSELGGSTPRSYNGTASVGDFLTITLDPVTQTLLYTNLSNGDSGTVPFSVNSDGTYTLNDPKGNLLAAYEVPDYALLIQAAKTGPNHDAPALITAVQKGSISVSTWAARKYNYMQFRTSSGGVEVGSANVDAHGNVTVSSYWPYGALGSGGAFHSGSFDVSMFQADPSGSFLKLMDDNSTADYVFGTANGVFAVDTANGAILGLEQATSADFLPSFAGNYKAIYYGKTAATTGMDNLEAGTPELGTATLEINQVGEVTILDSRDRPMLQAELTPVSEALYLNGSGKLKDPCYGIFTFRVITATSQQDVFFTFMDRAVLFSSFRADLPWASGNGYDYLYGVGLK